MGLTLLSKLLRAAPAFPGQAGQPGYTVQLDLKLINNLPKNVTHFKKHPVYGHKGMSINGGVRGGGG